MSTKLDEGNITAALWIFSFGDSPAYISSSILDRLRDKHPNEHACSHHLANPAEKPAFHVSEIAVLKAVRSFPAGSAGGQDGIRPQHLLELVQWLETGSRLLTSHGISQLATRGRCHKEFSQIMFLLAMEKKTGGIRQFVVGYMCRRLTPKYASAHALADNFNLLQVGGRRRRRLRPPFTPPGNSYQPYPLTTS